MTTALLAIKAVAYSNENYKLKLDSWKIIQPMNNIVFRTVKIKGFAKYCYYQEDLQNL